MYKVLKKDGQVENFDWGKIRGVLEKAGAGNQEVERVCIEVEEWLNTVADENGTIRSYDLHVKVLEVLKKINPTAGAAFEAFRKPDPAKE